MEKQDDFSWSQTKKEAIITQVKRAKLMAHDQHPDYKRLHPDEAREASQGKYTLLEIRVKKEVKDKQDKAIQRRHKRSGKKI